MPTLTFLQDTFAQHIQQNPYPGRGLVVGRSSADDGWLLIYWIMGRSAHSRNRRFVAEGGTLRTEPVDANLVADPSLIIYDAMLELPSIYLVSNGDQTRTLYDAFEKGGSFDEALAQRQHEPDAPNYTPRISAMLDLRTSPLAPLTLSILKANLFDTQRTDRFTYRPASPPPGTGVGLTTYMGDGNPLPTFCGDPLWLPCVGSPDEVLEMYWQALNKENRISLAVKHVGDNGGSSIVLRNRFDIL